MTPTYEVRGKCQQSVEWGEVASNCGRQKWWPHIFVSRSSFLMDNFSICWLSPNRQSHPIILISTNLIYYYYFFHNKIHPHWRNDTHLHAPRSERVRAARKVHHTKANPHNDFQTEWMWGLPDPSCTTRFVPLSMSLTYQWVLLDLGLDPFHLWTFLPLSPPWPCNPHSIFSIEKKKKNWIYTFTPFVFIIFFKIKV